MSTRSAHKLARILKTSAQERAESAMTKVANEFGTVIDTDPLQVMVHASNMVLDEGDLYLATIEASDLAVDDTVLLLAVGNHWVLVAEIGDEAVAKLKTRITAGIETGDIGWADITDKPTTFPPSTHTHAIADVTSLQASIDAMNTAIAARALVGHTHTRAEITDFAHTHAIADVTGLQAALDAKAALSHTHAQVDVTNLVTDLAAKAPLASPTFTGDPKAPTPATADNNTSIATTAFVKAQGYAALASPTFTGDPKAPTPATADNDTSIATTAFVKVQGYTTQALLDAHKTSGDHDGRYFTETESDARFAPLVHNHDSVYYTETEVDAAILAAKARANHTGTQLAATISDFHTEVRTSRLDQMAAPTAAVAMGGQKLTGLAAGAANGESVRYEQITGLAPLASPTFTGDPKAPTPAAGDNDTSVATTAFVKAQGYQPTSEKNQPSGYPGLSAGGFVVPAQLGSGTPDGTKYLRDDGTWQTVASAPPADATTSNKGIVQLAGDLAGTATAPTVPGLAAKAPLASPAFTGVPTAPTPPPSDSSEALATTGFVDGHGPGLMNNGGFDQGEFASGVTPGWTFNSAVVDSSGLVEAPPRTGHGKAARLTVDTGGAAAYVISTETGDDGGDIPVIAGQRYTFVGWVKGDAKPLRARPLLYTADDRTGAAGPTVSMQDAGSASAYGPFTYPVADQWTPLRYSFLCPGTPGTVYWLRTLVYTDATIAVSDTFDFDDFEVYPDAAMPVVQDYEIVPGTPLTQLDMPVDGQVDYGWKVELDLVAHYDASLAIRLEGSATATQQVRRVATGRQDASLGTSDAAVGPPGVRLFDNIGSLTSGETYVVGEAHIGKYQGGGRVVRTKVGGAGTQAVSGALDWTSVNDSAFRLMGSTYEDITYLRLFSDQASGLIRGRVRVTRL